jgi:hypothetical protein
MVQHRDFFRNGGPQFGGFCEIKLHLVFISTDKYKSSFFTFNLRGEWDFILQFFVALIYINSKSNKTEVKDRKIQFWKSYFLVKSGVLEKNISDYKLTDCYYYYFFFLSLKDCLFGVQD